MENQMLPDDFKEFLKLLNARAVDYLLNEIDGVEFKDCFARRSSVEIDGVEVNLISLADLRV